MSVFRGSNSSTAWPAGPEPIPDGPTERLNGPVPDPAPAPPRRGVVLAVLLAMLALLTAAASGLLAWRALERADLAFARPVPVTTAPPAGAYGEEVLRIQAGCTGVTFVDLDEPRVNAAGPVSDLRYDSRCDDGTPQLTLAPGALGGSDVGDADVDGPGCAKAVRTSPLGGGLIVPVRTGLVLCVLTGSGAAPGTAIRLVRVRVDEVRRDGTARLRATAWPAS